MAIVFFLNYIIVIFKIYKVCLLIKGYSYFWKEIMLHLKHIATIHLWNVSKVLGVSCPDFEIVCGFSLTGNHWWRLLSGILQCRNEISCISLRFNIFSPVSFFACSNVCILTCMIHSPKCLHIYLSNYYSSVHWDSLFVYLFTNLSAYKSPICAIWYLRYCYFRVFILSLKMHETSHYQLSSILVPSVSRGRIGER